MRVTAFQPSSFTTSWGLPCGGSLSYRDVEDPLADRGLDISCDTIRSWVLTFGGLSRIRCRARDAIEQGRIRQPSSPPPSEDRRLDRDPLGARLR